MNSQIIVTPLQQTLSTDCVPTLNRCRPTNALHWTTALLRFWTNPHGYVLAMASDRDVAERMRFTLHYRGPLKANRGARDKHLLRRYFHEQLSLLWDQAPLPTVTHLQYLSEREKEGEISLLYPIGNFNIHTFGEGSPAPHSPSSISPSCVLDLQAI